MNDRDAIRSAISDFANAYNSGDIDKVVSYYTDDHIKLRNGAPLETKADVYRRLADVFDKFQTRVDAVIDEIQIAGDLAFTRGSFRVTLEPKSGGASQTIQRRSFEIWRKEHGQWRVARFMDNVE